MAMTEALLLDPLTEESQREVADLVGRLPALGPGWWDRYPAATASDRDDQAAADYRAQVAAFALIADGEIGGP